MRLKKRRWLDGIALLAVVGAIAIAGHWHTRGCRYWWEDPLNQEGCSDGPKPRADHANLSLPFDINGVHLGAKMRDIPRIHLTRQCSGMIGDDLCPQMDNYVAPGVLMHGGILGRDVVSDMIGTDLNQGGRRLLSAGDSRAVVLRVMGRPRWDLQGDSSNPGEGRIGQDIPGFDASVGIDECLMFLVNAGDCLVTIDMRACRVCRVEVHQNGCD